MRKLAGLLLAAALGACSPKPEPANPALWEVTGPSGEKAWLFGTIHSLARPALWRTPNVERALAGSNVIMVEMNDRGHEKETARIFAELSHSPGQPALTRRVSPELRDQLEELLDDQGIGESSFATTETWAAALSLARTGDEGLDPAFGIDRAVIGAAGTRTIVELEGARRQLGLFDGLPEREQRDLLDAVVRDAHQASGANGSLTEAWRRGDMATIERETRRGMLADPELRAALFTRRNQDWASAVADRMARGARPLVAVGAAHMAGADGLPALLAARGYQVVRVQ